MKGKGVKRWALLVAVVGIASAAAFWTVRDDQAGKKSLAEQMPIEKVQVESAQSIRQEPSRSCMKRLNRFTADSGRNESAGCLPGDIDLDQFAGADAGERGILFWRQKEEAGDYYIEEPWLFRPGGSGNGLAKPGVYLYSRLAWLPGRGLIALNAGNELMIISPDGKVVKTAVPDPGCQVIGLAVNPENDRIAVLLISDSFVNWSDQSLPVDLAVLSPDGETLSRLKNISGIGHSDGFLQPFGLYWLPDGRIAFEHRTDDPPLGESAEAKKVVLADPITGNRRQIDIVTSGIAAVSTKGLILLSEGKTYDPFSGKVLQVPLPSEVFLDKERYSPEGRFFTARKFGENGKQLIGIVSVDDGSWKELDQGVVIGWAPDGSLYWAAKDENEG